MRRDSVLGKISLLRQKGDIVRKYRASITNDSLVVRQAGNVEIFGVPLYTYECKYCGKDPNLDKSGACNNCGSLEVIEKSFLSPDEFYEFCKECNYIPF